MTTDDELAQRLAKIKGEDPIVASKYTKNQTIVASPAPNFDDEVNALINQTIDQHNAKNSSIQYTNTTDDDLLKRYEKLKGSPAVVAQKHTDFSDLEELDEDTQVNDIIAQALDENRLEEKTGISMNTNETQKSPDEPIKKSKKKKRK